MVDNEQTQTDNNHGSEVEDTQHTRDIALTLDKIEEYCNNYEILRYVKSQFRRLNHNGAIILIRQLLLQNPNIKATTLSSGKQFYRDNMGKFDGENKKSNKNKILKLELMKSFRSDIIDIVLLMNESITHYDKEKHKQIKQEEISGEECYVLNNLTDYEGVRRLICDEGGEANFKYDFDSADLQPGPPKSINTLQRCMIQISSVGVKFDYPIVYIYNCPRCNTRTRKKAYETASVKTRVDCSGVYNYINPQTQEAKSRVCGLSLHPDEEIGLTKDAYYYDMNYEDKGGVQQSIGAFSFNSYEPGFYDCVLFKVKNPKKVDFYHLIDIKPLTSNKFSLPEKVERENYVITLSRAFDEFIKQQTGVEIYGLAPIKVALVLQSVISASKDKLNFNIQIIGDSATGKSTVLKYYGFLLHNNFNIMSAGVNISVPGLRGTKQTVSLMGRDYKIITVGYLGTHKAVHIDEAGENKILIQNLKTFLLEDNYSYDRAGSTGVFRKRTAQINLSENLDFNHLGQYRGLIRKAYKEDDTQIGEEEKSIWDEQWNLHLPLFKYTNSYLLSVVREKREEYAQKQMFWIDGYDIALHERFPFYFYIVKTDMNEKLSEIIKRNLRKMTISENLELIKVLKNEEVPKFFKLVQEKLHLDSDVEGFEKVDEILKQYGIVADARSLSFYYRLVKTSRAINMRDEINEEDYDLLRWIIETTNCRLDFNDIVEYKVDGPPNIKEYKDRELLIEEQTSKKDDDAEFGLPDGEFQ